MATSDQQASRESVHGNFEWRPAMPTVVDLINDRYARTVDDTILSLSLSVCLFIFRETFPDVFIRRSPIKNNIDERDDFERHEICYVSF